MVSSVVSGKATLCFKNPLAVSQSCINSDSGAVFPETTCIRIALNANKIADGNGSLKRENNLNSCNHNELQEHTLLCLVTRAMSLLSCNNQLQLYHFQQASKQKQFRLHSTIESTQSHLSYWNFHDKGLSRVTS